MGTEGMQLKAQSLDFLQEFKAQGDTGKVQIEISAESVSLP